MLFGRGMDIYRIKNIKIPCLSVQSEDVEAYVDRVITMLHLKAKCLVHLSLFFLLKIK